MWCARSDDAVDDGELTMMMVMLVMMMVVGERVL